MFSMFSKAILIGGGAFAGAVVTWLIMKQRLLEQHLRSVSINPELDALRQRLDELAKAVAEGPTPDA